ncbi:MAG: TlpA disulfide reductase family protein [Perlucidibaca sp.]
MSRFLTLICLLAGLSLPVSALALSRGEPAPDFRLHDGQGRVVTLSSLRGRVVYLDFWASWCGPCRQSFPWMDGLQQRLGRDRLVVLAVNVDEDAEAASQFLKELRPGFSVVFDTQGRTALRYALPGMPASFLIGPDGRLLWGHLGFRAEDGSRLEAAIRQALPR